MSGQTNQACQYLLLLPSHRPKASGQGRFVLARGRVNVGGQGNPLGVEQQARRTRLAAIQAIPQDRRAEVGQMHTQLVDAASLRPQAHQLMGLRFSLDSIAGARIFAPPARPPSSGRAAGGECPGVHQSGRSPSSDWAWRRRPDILCGRFPLETPEPAID